MMDPIRIAVVDDQPIFRMGISHALGQSGVCKIIAEGQTYDDALQIAKKFMPQVMLLDTHIVGCGIKALERITQSFDAVKTIMMGSADCESTCTASLKAGARGFILKGLRSEQLVDIVSTVHNGKMYMDPTLAANILSQKTAQALDDTPGNLARLTVRETQVLKGASKGLTNKEIARHHGLSEKTIKHHMTNILQKLHARNRVEAIIKAGKFLDN